MIKQENMNMLRYFMKKISFRIFCLPLMIILCALTFACQTAQKGTTYYIDSFKGDDSNSGMTASQAWQTLEKVNSTIFKAGDKIMFKADKVWNGQLWPKGSGSKNNTIIIDMYGKGNKPVINGNGEVTNTVMLRNQEYWEIKNLEITNYNKNDSISFKKGVCIEAEDFGTIHHIHLINLDVHLVNGNIAPGDANSSKYNGGIFFHITGSKKPANFDDVFIEGCHIYDVGRTGISLKSSWDKRTLTTNTNWYPSENVIIRNNVFENISGEGLIWRVSHKPLVEHNVFSKCALDLSGNAMFFFNCDSAIAQYNEAYLTVYEPGETDASGFDADYQCKNTIYQYNYSHDNGMGAFVVCTNGKSPTAFQDGAVYRYNISQNENREVFHLSGPLTNTRLYNNVIYSGPDKNSVKVVYHKNWGGYPDDTHYYNNIFYILSENPVYDLGSSTNNVFDYNVFYGQHPESEPQDPHKIISDPKFVSSGRGAVGINTVEGYKLRPNSPCIDSGKLLPDNAEKDFWGNPVNENPDRGAHEVQRK